MSFATFDQIYPEAFSDIKVEKEQDLFSFIEKHKVDYSSNRITEDFIPELEKKLGVKVGTQMKDYLLNYGYLGYEYLEFLGINSVQGFESDMVKKTERLYSAHESLRDFLVIEAEEHDSWYIVDSNDRVFRLDLEQRELWPENKDLFAFIWKRFCEIACEKTCRKCIHFDACEVWAHIIFADGTTFPYEGEKSEPCELYKTRGDYEFEVITEFVNKLKAADNRFVEESDGVAEFVSAETINSFVEAYRRQKNAHCSLKSEEKTTE